MIIPMVCFTCGRPIAHLWENYNHLLRNYEILLNNMSVEPRNQGRTAEYLALRDLHIGTMCCRRMLVCQHDMYTKIN
jgi:DNA-directed RNA polymerase subunit N (RpoN/RPB10)